MNSILHHPAPHVEPGTNFNLHRFHELYRWMAAMSADAVRAAMRPNGYGLLLAEDEKPALDLQLSGNTLLLSRCCAVTPGGTLIGIFEEKWGSGAALSVELSPAATGDFDVAVVAMPGRRQPVGEADLEEVPERQPFSLPFYRLEVCPAGQKDFSKLPFALKIGEMRNEGGKYSLKEHIPACVQLGAHPVLWKKYLEYDAELGRLKECMSAIARQTSETNPDLKNLRELALCLGKFLSERQAEVWALGRKGAPEKLFTTCIAFANLLRFCLESNPRELELMELIRHNVDSTVGLRFQPQALRDAVGGMAASRYVHSHILQSIYQADVFFSLANPPFQVLKNRVAPVNGVRVW